MALEKYLKLWLSDQTLQQNMIGAYMQKGGWEGWAQVEFASFLTRNNYYKSVQRELTGIFKSGERADLLCSGDLAAQTYINDIIELKTETLFQSGSGKDDFKKRVEGDIQKIQGPLASPYPTNSRVTAIGISIAAQTTKAVSTDWSKMANIQVYADKTSTWWIVAFYVMMKPN
jgi:hypothetical protein